MRLAAALLCAFAWFSPALAGEPPALADEVAAGKLPPLPQRLPVEPLVVRVDAATGREPGRNGGTIRMLMAEQGDLRLMTVYGYARLVAFDRNLKLGPDILLSYENDRNRVFTLRLRPGHKWSDGSPFTAEDFRYQWEDVLTDKDLDRGGLPPELTANGKGPKFEVLDPETVRYTWEDPNPLFLPALAGARPLDIYSASGYLKQFHKKYADPDKLAAAVKAEKVKDWKALQTRKARSYRFENPDLPTLQPWQNMTAPPSDRFVFRRNPYFHRVDQNGLQLPYADEVVFNIAEPSVIPAKAGSGEVDLQERYLGFADYTFLKEGEERNNYTVRLWTVGRGSALTLMPNLNAKDPAWRAAMRDVRLRRALSLAIDREEINQVLYSGLAKPGASTVLPGSALYRDELGQSYAAFDLNKANQLLDEAGYARGSDGLRRLPDGQKMNLVVEASGSSPMEADMLELVQADWAKVGVRLLTRTSQRDIFRSRVAAGSTVMSVWTGVDNGSPTADISPAEFVPTDPYQLQWPAWGTNISTRGKQGEVIDDPGAKELVELYRQWLRAEDEAAKLDAWTKILRITADQVYTIGMVSATLAPVLVSNRLANVPEAGILAFDPYAYFGVYGMDTFFFRN